jgi:hypothetical protein
VSKPHIQIRNGLIDDHLSDGRMDGDMYTAFNVMLRQCDWATGIWRGCSERLVDAMGGLWSPATARRILKRLANARYITSGFQNGRLGRYDIFINNYYPPTGANKGKKLRPTKTLKLDLKPAKSRVSEKAKSAVSRGPTLVSDEPNTSERRCRSAVSRYQDSMLQDSKTQDSSSTEGSKEGSQVSLASLTTLGFSGEENTEGLPDPLDEQETDFHGGMDMYSRMNEPNPNYMLPRSQRALDSDEWFIVHTLYREVFNIHPKDKVDHAHILAFAEVVLDLGERTGWKVTPESPEFNHPVREFMIWNQQHKTGGMVFANGHDMAKAYFSDSQRNARWQWENHDPDTCSKCIRRNS